MSIIEEWRPIAGYEGVYEVSDQGRVRSLDRLVRANSGWRSTGIRYFTPSPSGKNRKYKKVLLRNPKKQYLVHRLVLEAFVGPRPDNCEARHLDGDPSNNRLDNLAWGTKAETRPTKLNTERYSAALQIPPASLPKPTYCAYVQATKGKLI